MKMAARPIFLRVVIESRELPDLVSLIIVRIFQELDGSYRGLIGRAKITTSSTMLMPELT
jgi:hypothetical protein